MGRSFTAIGKIKKAASLQPFHTLNTKNKKLFENAVNVSDLPAAFTGVGNGYIIAAYKTVKFHINLYNCHIVIAFNNFGAGSAGLFNVLFVIQEIGHFLFAEAQDLFSAQHTELYRLVKHII